MSQSSVEGQMGALRVEANTLFPVDPARAATLYDAALEVFEVAYRRRGGDGVQSTNQQPTGATPRMFTELPWASQPSAKAVEEFTKCASNACTCYYAVGELDACLNRAEVALAVNPLCAKAHAFLGRCLLRRSSGHDAVTAAEVAHMHLSRAVFLLPSLAESMKSDFTSAVRQMRLAERTPAAAAPRDLAVMPVRTGQGVVTPEPLPAGTVVCWMRAPFSVGLYDILDGGEGYVCVCCAAVTAEAHEVCGVCAMVSFCTAACKAQYATQHQQYECDAMCRLRAVMDSFDNRGANPPENFFSAAYHCITTLAGLKAKRVGCERVMALESHAVEVTQAHPPTMQLLHDVLPAEDPARVAMVVGLLQCNALEVSDATGLGLGQALHAAGVFSYFNHSCAPNCAINATQEGIVTIRAIGAGEELSIAYLPQLYWPHRMRREVLSERFLFTCHCPRCDAAERGGDVFEKVVSCALPLAAVPRDDGASAAAAAQMARVGSDGDEDAGPGGSAAVPRLLGKVQHLCGSIRAMAVEQIRAGHVTELLTLRAECLRHVFPFHYLLQDVRNTLTFVYTVLGRTRECLASCMEELLMWESLLPGALPVKQAKLRNALCCLSQLGGPRGVDDGWEAANVAAPPPLRHHLGAYAELYGVDGDGGAVGRDGAGEEAGAG